jgi:hypothetical protein
MEALAGLRRRGVTFRWIHAGEERPSEYRLREAIDAHPGLRDVSTITGYVTEADLDAYIAAADLVVNLRFPSVGESSGTMARALSAGRCCIVSDTAAYAELPRDSAVHVPIIGAVPALACAIDGLVRNAGLRAAFGMQAARYAQNVLAPRTVARQYADFIDSTESLRKARARSRKRTSAVRNSAVPLQTIEVEHADALPAPALRQRFKDAAGPFEALLWFSTVDEAARYSLANADVLRCLFGPHVAIDNVRFVNRKRFPGNGAARGAPAIEVGLSVLGRAHGW